MTPNPTAGANAPWWSGLNRYQWSVFILASLGWVFDCFDQQLFTMSRSITMRELVPGGDFTSQTKYGGFATTAFILGWATGGLIFGVIGDLWGRAKTMALTILVYAAFTGLSALSTGWLDFSIYRFLTGLGVGGEFAVGVALIAEVMPDRARATALGSLQALSAVGNILAAVMIWWIDELGGWRRLYWIGAAPALLACVSIFMLKEPQKWLDWRARVRQAGAPPQQGRVSLLLGHPRWRRNTAGGLALAIAGVFGLWGVAFYSGELIDSTLLPMPSTNKVALARVLAAETIKDHEARVAELTPSQTGAYKNLLKYTVKPSLPGSVANPASIPNSAQKEQMTAMLARSLDSKAEKRLKSQAFILQQIGGFLGILFVSYLANRIGRRAAMAIAMISGFTGAVIVFTVFSAAGQIYYLWPLLGFCTLMPFGGFAIYFPELFPTSLRSTGVSFCYNVGRYITAFGPLLLPMLANNLHGQFELSGFRCAALILCGAYSIGLIALFWAPETKGQPLPEEATA